MKSIKIGHSTNGQSKEILANSSDVSNRKILVMSGLHGDEIEGVALNSMILSHCHQSNGTLLDDLLFLPVANPDGFTFNQRWNFNRVDLNRNWPTKDWSAVITNPRYPPGPQAESEVETINLRKFIESSNIEFVIDLHSYKDSVLLPLFHQAPSNLSHSLNLLSTGLEIPIEFEQDNLGYSISGGFHTWCFENKIQNLTIEIEKGFGQFSIKERYLAPIIEFIRTLI